MAVMGGACPRESSSCPREITCRTFLAAEPTPRRETCWTERVMNVTPLVARVSHTRRCEPSLVPTMKKPTADLQDERSLPMSSARRDLMNFKRTPCRHNPKKTLSEPRVSFQNRLTPTLHRARSGPWWPERLRHHFGGQRQAPIRLPSRSSTACCAASAVAAARGGDGVPLHQS